MLATYLLGYRPSLRYLACCLEFSNNELSPHPGRYLPGIGLLLNNQRKKRSLWRDSWEKIIRGFGGVRFGLLSMLAHP